LAAGSTPLLRARTPKALGSADFKRVLRRGRRINSAHLVCCIEVPATQNTFGLGICVPKRFLKSAVLRNVVKRQIREAARLGCGAVGLNLVFLGRTPFLKQGSDLRVAKRNLSRLVRAECEGLLARCVGQVS
jgi:ribonuclease P protein component